MRTRAVPVVLLCLALPLAACDGAPPDAEQAPGGVPSSPSDSTSPTPSAPLPTPAPAPAEVVIAVAGDVHFEGPLRARLADPATALAPVTRTLAAADVAVVNLETSVGEGGRPEPGKRFTFQAPATALTALAAAGVDVATMANNHALDHGRAALGGTFDAVDAARAASPPLAVVGIGRDARAAFRPAVLDVRGTTVAVLGATRAALDPTADPTGGWAATATAPGTADAVDPRRLLRAVARAEATADVVVVYVHWGVQGTSCPTDDQRSLAARLVRQGADVVVGSHAHQLQGDGRLGAGYVAYGLGNYAWYTPTDLTGVLTLRVQPPETPLGRATVTAAGWEPAGIGTDGLPRPLTGPARADFGTELRGLRACAGLT